MSNTICTFEVNSWSDSIRIRAVSTQSLNTYLGNRVVKTNGSEKQERRLLHIILLPYCIPSLILPILPAEILPNANFSTQHLRLSILLAPSESCSVTVLTRCCYLVNAGNAASSYINAGVISLSALWKATVIQPLRFPRLFLPQPRCFMASVLISFYQARNFPSEVN